MARLRPSPFRFRLPPGFSLVELTVALVVTALLATLAMPSFSRSLRRSHRSEAIAALLELQLRQERWRADHAGYAADAATLGAPTQGPVAERYVMSVVVASPVSYRLRATARDGSTQLIDVENGQSCARLEIDQDGARTPEACWR